MDFLFTLDPHTVVACADALLLIACAALASVAIR
jgi:hypothetical protein